MAALQVALLVFGMLGSACGQALPPEHDPTGYDRDMSRRALQDPLAQCNDGSPAVYYSRNCTANADRAKGDTTDYCLKGGPQGVKQNIWVVLFESAPGLCHDQASCSSREQRLMSSKGLPATLFPSGALSVYPEENPNLYKASMAFVPSCSSDLFLGDSAAGTTVFRGARILEGVLRELSEGPMQAADVIVIAGGAGVIQKLGTPRVRRLLPPKAVVQLVCDDCLLLRASPRVSIQEQPCSTDLDCPAPAALEASLPAWNATLGEGCTKGECLLWPSTGMTAALSSSFLFQNLFQESQLRALRAWPPTRFSAARQFSVQLADGLRLQLKSLNSSNVFAAGCGSEQLSGGNPEAVGFVNQRQFFHTQVVTTNLYNVSIAVSYNGGVSDFIQGVASGNKAGIDNCTGFECNKVDSGFGQFTQCGVSSGATMNSYHD